MIIPAGYAKIGDFEFGEECKARCVVVVKIKGKGKIDKKASDGKSDAITTFKGREPADVSIELSWDTRDDDADTAIEDALRELAPRGPNGGKAFDFVSRRSDVHDVSKIVVEEIEGPNDTPGTTQSTAKISAASWAKQKNSTKTANGAGKGTTVDNFGGIPGNKVTFPPGNTPTVVP